MTKFCPNPFEWLDITANNGVLRLSWCIQSWAGTACHLWSGTFEEAAKLDLHALYHQQAVQRVRKQWADGDVPEPCRCCPRFLNGSTPPRDRSEDDPPSVMPRVLNLAYDASCNLCCPSCRRYPIVHAPGTEIHRAIVTFQDAVVRPLLQKASHVFLAGLGDPFGSPSYWELLRTVQPEDAPDLRWSITTNGHGFTPARYEAIPTRAQIETVQFSVDAATPETYTSNRGHGWDHLLTCLEFVGQLRKSGAIKCFEISMVIQRNNWRETIAFVDLAEQYGCDTVIFNGLLNQGSYTQEEYAERNVLSPDHPEFISAIMRLVQAVDLASCERSMKCILELPRSDS